MNLSTFTRIFIGFVILILIVVGLVTIFSLKIVEDRYIGVLTSHLEDLALGIKPLVVQHFGGEPTRIDSIVKEMSSGIRARLTLVDAQGNVLADSDQPPEKVANQGMRPEIMKALSGHVGIAKSYNGTLEQDMLYVAVPVRKGGMVAGAIRSAMSFEELDVLLGEIRGRVAVIAISVAAIAIGVSFFISQTLTRPLKDLKAAATNISLGNLDTHVLLKGGTELKALADSFNCMVDEIRKLFEDMTARRSELGSVFASVEDGIVIISGDGKILRFNPAFAKIVDRDDIEGRYYWEVLQYPDLASLLNEAKATGAMESRTIKHSGRVYTVSARWLDETQGALLVFHDVTDAHRLARLKKELVENVSHELRTPLTALKGFLETLEDEVSASGKQYLEIAQRHAQRLTSLVNDLLTLSHLEDASAKLRCEIFDLRDLIEEVARSFEVGAKAKGLKLLVEKPEDAVVINADRLRLEQLLVNLLSNALQYTDEGSIMLRLEGSPNEATLIVSDTGIGISEEHLPHIFERFYVVDRSRSRIAGGTGLGLAIVKHIVLLHNGRIDVASKVGEGTTFKVGLPLGEKPLTRN